MNYLLSQIIILLAITFATNVVAFQQAQPFIARKKHVHPSQNLLSMSDVKEEEKPHIENVLLVECGRFNPISYFPLQCIFEINNTDCI
jgi:hypothetical protein